MSERSARVGTGKGERFRYAAGAPPHSRIDLTLRVRGDT
jgi:hypothetical protein